MNGTNANGTRPKRETSDAPPSEGRDTVAAAFRAIIDDQTLLERFAPQLRDARFEQPPLQWLSTKLADHFEQVGEAPGLPRVRDWLDAYRMDGDRRALVEAFIQRIEKHALSDDRHGYYAEKLASVIRHARVSAARSHLERERIDKALYELTAWSEFESAGAPKPLMSYADIAATPPDTEPWLVEGLIKRKGINLVYGMPEAGKTWFLLDLIAAVASGQMLLGLKTKQCRVLYIDEDVGIDQVHARAPRLAAGRGLDWTQLPVKNRFNHGVRLDDPVWVRRLTRDIKDNDIGLLVIETARSVFDGDENSSADVSKLFRNLKAIRDATDVTIVLSHHTPKDGKNKSYRGSGVFGADIDMSVSVKGENGEFEVKLTKARWGKKVFRSIAVKLVDSDNDDSVSLVTVDDGEDIADAARQQPLGKLQKAKLFIIALLRDADEPMQHTEIISAAKKAGHSETTAKDALRSLHGEHVVKKVEGHYSLADEPE